MGKKCLSSTAVDVISRCAKELETSVDELIKEFEPEWEPAIGEYSRKLLEYCSSKALKNLCSNLQEKISDGSFGRHTFNMMLAWEMPNSAAEEDSYTECMAKEKEDRKVYAKTTEEQDETPLFYSDIMPLLVDNGPSANEDAFVWLAALAPVVADVVNARFTFEALTAPTGNQLYFPAHDKLVKEIDKCVKNLQNNATPSGVELADDEFILHVEGTASTPRVVRHIGVTNWPGRLTLTNYALYFEPSGIVSYEDAFKIDLSKATDLSVKPAATGPWGAPLFDKAIVIESSELQEAVILEFPELTSSTRRDLWLALVKEILLLHQFLLKFKMGSKIEAWELHARTILGIIRLHAAREMLRMSPPIPRNFLIFALCDELPKGDYVIEELATSLKKLHMGHPCSASTILRSLNVSQTVPSVDIKELSGTTEIVDTEKFSSLDSTINQAREEAREMRTARVTVKELKEEGIIDSARILLALLEPVKSMISWSQHIIRWESPEVNMVVIALLLIVIYKEWVGKAIAVFLLCLVAKMFWMRRRRRKIQVSYDKIVICTASDQSTMESIVSAQQGLRTVHEVMQETNVALLKLWSVLTAKSSKHTDMVVIIFITFAIILAIIPLKYLLIAMTLHGFLVTSKLGKHMVNEQGNRRLKEWWESIPVPTVEFTDKSPDCTTKFPMMTD